MVENILELLKKYKITAKKLTEAIDIPLNNITEWKNGRAKPSLSAMIKIADYFGMSLDDLVGRKLPNAMIVQPEKTIPQEIAELWNEFNDQEKNRVYGFMIAIADNETTSITDNNNKTN